MFIYVVLAVLACIGARMMFSWFYRSTKFVDVVDRYVFITGCDTGFGHLLARALDAKGLPVFAGCLTEEGARGLMKVCSSRLQCVKINVTDKDSVQQALKSVKSRLPPDQGLWGLVNNAGIMPNFAPAEWLQLEDYERVCRVNLFGTVSVTLTFLPLIRKAKGRVVNVSSVVGFTAFPGTTDYCISKAGVRMFNNCLRRELYSSGVSVHMIEPGGFTTNITNIDRLQNLFEQAYNSLDDELRSFYGGTIITRVYKNFVNPPTIKQDPRRVVACMERALLSVHPHRNYTVGYDATLLFKPLAYLPDWVGDFLLGWPQPYGPVVYRPRPSQEEITE